MGKLIAKVSRINYNLILSKIVGIDTNEHSTESINNIDTCTNDCIYKELGDNSKCLHCVNNTLNNRKKTTDINSTNNKKYFTKTQILQYIYYHFLPLDSSGCYDYISETVMALELGISIKTLRRNNIVLEKSNLVKITKEEPGYFSLSIINYTDAFKKGNEGTINITYTFFEKIKRIKNIDIIRVSLALYEKHFSHTGYTKNTEIESRFTLKKIKKIIPNGKNYNKYIKGIFNNLDGIFKFDFVKTTVSTPNKDVVIKSKKVFNFKLLKGFNYEEVFANINKTVIDITQKIVGKIKFNNDIGTKDLDDLTQLAGQYGYIHLEKALARVYIPKNKANFNLGAIVRANIEDEFKIY